MAGHILVLDDEEKYALMLQELLSEHGFCAEICTDPRQALERLRQQHFDLVVADYKMPVIDGAEFLLKARKTNPSLPVIMVSGLMNMPELLKVANIGVTLVLEKPFNTEEFINQVSRFVEPVQEEPEVSGAPELSPEMLAQDDTAVKWTYPQPAHYWADQSREARLFVQTLWDYSQTFRHIFVEVPPGGEIEVVQREWTGWRNEPDGYPRLHFSLQELQSESVRQELLAWCARDDQSSVVVIGVQADANNPDQLTDFICYVEEQDILRDRVGWLYSLPENWLNKVGQLSLKTPYVEACAPQLLKIPALRVRPEDVAEYAWRITNNLSGLCWEPDAVALLLSYDWPGNHAELLAAIRRARLTASDQGRISASSLQAAISRRHGDTKWLVATGVEAFLERRQADYLLGLGLPHDNWQEAASQAGLPVDRMDATKELSSQPLLYPEIITCRITPIGKD